MRSDVLKEKDLVIFDLDGTLTPAKMPMEPVMAEVFSKLLHTRKVAVISGGGWPRFETQLFRSLPSTDDFSDLFILPTSGTQLHVWKGAWKTVYAEHMSKPQTEKVMAAFETALARGGYQRPEKVYGELIEDRGSQITFSGLGQSAPLEAKAVWDPTREKRERIADVLREKLPEFDVRLGGTTSIDVTKRGVNKAYGIHKLEAYLQIPIARMLFVGDALFFGGNDYPAKSTGVDCVQVSGPKETEKLIGDWLKGLAIRPQ